MIEHVAVLVVIEANTLHFPGAVIAPLKHRSSTVKVGQFTTVSCATIQYLLDAVVVGYQKFIRYATFKLYKVSLIGNVVTYK